MLALQDAFDLTATCDVEMGGRTYTVPPLTFGRFQKALAVGIPDLPEALKRLTPGPERTIESFEDLAKQMLDVGHEHFTAIACAVIPGLKPAVWKEHGDLLKVIVLFDFLKREHDWSYISQTLGFKKHAEKEPGPNPEEFTAVLLVLAHELGCRLPELLELRLEGFYMSVDAVKTRQRIREEAREKAEHEAEGWTGPRPIDEVIKPVRDPEHAARIAKLVEEADARANQVIGEALSGMPARDLHEPVKPEEPGE